MSAEPAEQKKALRATIDFARHNTEATNQCMLGTDKYLGNCILYSTPGLTEMSTFFTSGGTEKMG